MTQAKKGYCHYMQYEGYVKYSANHTTAPIEKVPQLNQLNEARTKLYKLGLIGIYPNGIGFGNVSVRLKPYSDEFIISGTATGGKAVLDIEKDYCLVTGINIEKNCVESCGLIQASSESMTHGAVYRVATVANCVIHIHSAPIFNGMIRDQYPCTPKEAAYGTPQIAHEIQECVRKIGGNEGQIVLAGHDEGVIAYGSAIERTCELIVELYNRYRS